MPAYGRAGSTACCWWAVPPAFLASPPSSRSGWGRSRTARSIPDLCVALGAGVQAGSRWDRTRRPCWSTSPPTPSAPGRRGSSTAGRTPTSSCPSSAQQQAAGHPDGGVLHPVRGPGRSGDQGLSGGGSGRPEERGDRHLPVPGLNQSEGAHDQGLLFTYSLDLGRAAARHSRERATGRELRGVVENVIGRSTDEELGAARERVSALWGEAGAGDGDAAGGAEPSPAPAAVPPDVASETEETLARAVRALDAAPAEDREEMINLMEDLRTLSRRAAPAAPSGRPSSGASSTRSSSTSNSGRGTLSYLRGPGMPAGRPATAAGRTFGRCWR